MSADASERPLVSIVVIGYRAETTIAAAVRSALAQTLREIEVVVVDDGSDDGTRAVVAGIRRETGDGRLVIAPEAPNAGPSAARNRGLALARGTWIAFLDSDDVYEPGFAETMLAAARQDARTQMVVCSHTIVQVDGSRRVRTPACGAGVLSGRAAAVTLLEDRLTPYVWDKLFAREILGEQPFPQDIHRAEDAVAVLRACLAARSVRVIEDPLQVYAVSPTSLTWGRVAPLHESEKLMTAMSEIARPVLGSARGRRALRLSTVLTYLNTAHQAMIRLQGEERMRFVRGCARAVSWRDCLAVLRVRPPFGVAGALLKISPGVYRRAYTAYVHRSYAVAE